MIFLHCSFNPSIHWYSLPESASGTFRCSVISSVRKHIHHGSWNHQRAFILILKNKLVWMILDCHLPLPFCATRGCTRSKAGSITKLRRIISIHLKPFKSRRTHIRQKVYSLSPCIKITQLCNKQWKTKYTLAVHFFLELPDLSKSCQAFMLVLKPN